MKRVCYLLLLVCAGALLPIFDGAVTGSRALAAEPLVAFDDAGQRERYDRLLEEYRCLKCQNQNLAGSNAALAEDLRREIRVQLIAGADDAAIDEYLVSRYGEFVRYRPRFTRQTLLLWIGPFVLLAIGLAIGFAMVRRDRVGRPVAAGGIPVSGDQVAEARRLLDEQ